MSRSRSNATSASKGENASHPQENYPVYRSFLMRSLDRCDTELAALVELNRSLHTVKSSIMETCGEATLLDIGEGLLKLAPDDSDQLEGKIPEEGLELCIDFLLRMKLRRKLLNRLSRRLGRLAHAMDGEDIQPPSPPKYGDLRLHIDPRAVRSFEERWKRQKEAMKRIAMRHQSYIPPKEEEDNEPMEEESEKKDSEALKPAEEEEKGEDKPEEESGKSEKKVEGMEEGKSEEKPATEEETNDNVEGKAEAADDEGKSGAKAGEDVVMSEEKPGAEEAKSEEPEEEPEGAKAEEEQQQQQPASEGKPEGVTPSTGEQPVEETKSGAVEERTEEAKSGTAEQPAEEAKSGTGEQPTEETTSGSPTAAADDNVGSELLAESDYFDALKDYDEAYAKEILSSTGTVKYPILDQRGESDQNFPQYGAGIGATHRTLSSKDKEIEFKRWQSAVLQRIPDQPSFAELGLANRVFFLEERRKRLAEEDAMSPSKRKKSKKEESDGDSDSEKDSDDDVEMAEADDDGDEDYEAEKAKDEDDAEMEKKEDRESKSKDGGKADAVIVKPVKPISLAAVPSFHEQDMKRVRMIHAELMATSMHAHAQRRVGEATTEYNQAFRRSTELYNHRVKLQTDLNQLTYETRTKLAQLKNEYLHDVAVHRKRWEDRHREHALASLPSAHGIPLKGTPETAVAASHRDPVVANVGRALADIVDCVAARSESGWQDEDPIEPFRPPPQPDFSETVIDKNTEETLGQRQERLESGVRKQLTELASKLHLSEEERKKAWKKLLKTKAEFDMPHSHTTHAGGRRGRVSFGPNQFHLLPVPPLRASGAAAMPMPVTHSYPMASIPSYVPRAAPMPMPSSRPSTSESKYSAAKVRERHSADGSVAPASEPKRGKDGVYIRPPGRGRLGMDWDEVRGLWVPLPK